MKAYRLIVLLLFAANFCCAQNSVTYLRPVYNSPDTVQSGVAYWVRDTCRNCTTVVAGGTEWGVEGQSTWYVVNSVFLINGMVTCKGDVHLILMDNSRLSVVGNQTGIRVTSGNSLTVYAQSFDQQRMGCLTVSGGNYNAAIGGGYSMAGENITINGGRVSVTGGSRGAGIGGGSFAKGKNIVINGGIVTATGGEEGSGIGGGSERGAENIIINGGLVTATGGSNGVGIGGTSSSGIYFADSMLVKADASANPPLAVVAHANSGVDVAGLLAGKKYVTAVECLTFTVASDDENYGTVSKSAVRVPIFSSVVVYAHPASHCHLMKWSDGAKADTVRSVTVTRDTAITAYFELDWHRVSVDIEGGEGEAEGEGLYQYGEYVRLRAVAGAGYLFSSWKDGKDTVGLATDYWFTILSDTSFTLVFKVDPDWTSVEEVAEGLVMRNPVGVGESVVVRGGGIDYAEVYSMEGVLVCRKKASSGVVEIEGLAVAGVYIVRVVGFDGRVHTTKLFVR